MWYRLSWSQFHHRLSVYCWSHQIIALFRTIKTILRNNWLGRRFDWNEFHYWKRRIIFQPPGEPVGPSLFNKDALLNRLSGLVRSTRGRRASKKTVTAVSANGKRPQRNNQKSKSVPLSNHHPSKSVVPTKSGIGLRRVLREVAIDLIYL